MLTPQNPPVIPADIDPSDVVIPAHVDPLRLVY